MIHLQDGRSGGFARCFRVISLFAAVLMFSACKVGPDYERPEVPVPPGWADNAVAVIGTPKDDAVRISSLGWADLFQDAELKAVIQQALDHNKDLQIAVERVAQARAYATIAGAGRWPTIDAAQLSERESESALTNDPPDPRADELFLGLTFAWEIDLWGRQRRISDAGFARYLAAEYGAQAVRLSLIAEVASAYFDLQGARAREVISHETVAARMRSWEIAQKRFRGGLTSRLEVTQSEVDLASSRGALVRAEQQTALAQNRLSILLGQPPGPQSLQVALDQHDIPADVTADLPLRLLDRRPDLMAAEQEVIAACQEVGVATADLLPNIFLTADGGIQSQDFDDLLNRDGDFWIVNLDILMPLFNAGARRAELTAAEHRYNEARLQWEQALLGALREVADALVRFRKSGEELEAVLVLQQASEEYLTLAFKRYRNGVLAYIDVLDAQRSLYLAQIGVSQARLARLQALVQIYKSLGGGWNPEEFQTTIGLENHQ